MLKTQRELFSVCFSSSASHRSVFLSCLVVSMCLSASVQHSGRRRGAVQSDPGFLSCGFKWCGEPAGDVHGLKKLFRRPHSYRYGYTQARMHAQTCEEMHWTTDIDAQNEQSACKLTQVEVLTHKQASDSNLDRVDKADIGACRHTCAQFIYILLAHTCTKAHM